MMVQSITVHTSTKAGNLPERSTVAKKGSQSNFDILLGNCAGSGNTADTKGIKDNRVVSKAGQDRSDGQDDKSVQDKKTEKQSTGIDKAARSDNKTALSKANDADKDQMPDSQTIEENGSDIVATLAGQIMNMLEQIRSAIAKVLGVSEEELDSMMEELGLDSLDLLEPEAIKQLVLYNSGAADATVLLLDEQINDTFRNITTIVEDIKKDAGLELNRTEVEQILENYGVSLDDNNDQQAGDMLQTVLNEFTVAKEINPEEETEADTDKLIGISESRNYESPNSIEISVNKKEAADTGERNESFDMTDGFEAFLNKLDAGYEKTVAEITDENPKLYNIKDIAREIIEQVRIMAKPGQSTLELKLYPEHLGKVSVTIRSNAEGVMTARLVVENELAKEAVEGQMFALRENLEQQGIRVESIEVTIAGFSFEQNGSSDEQGNTQQKNEGSGRKITLEQAVAMSEEPTQEAAVDITGVSGHNIDYTA